MIRSQGATTHPPQTGHPAQKQKQRQEQEQKHPEKKKKKEVNSR